MSVNADSIPRYAPPTPAELEAMFGDPDFDEVITCADCGHCFEVGKVARAQVCNRLSHYGKWRKHEREVRREIMHALGCFGVCEVKGELVPLDDVPCDHFGAHDD